MPNLDDLNLTVFIDVAIRALSERTDPLISRVNEGGVLTNAECKQVMHDLFKLTSIMKASAEAMELSIKEISDRDKEIKVMRALLGLGDLDTAGK